MNRPVWRRGVGGAFFFIYLLHCVKWATHILWGVAALAIFHVDPVSAAVASSIHTVVTDVLGHKGLRRSRYHGLISMLAAAALAIYFRSPAALLLGPLHIALDAASPGRLAVSWAYNAVWSLPAALLIAQLY
jgi:hypothetical protein